MKNQNVLIRIFCLLAPLFASRSYASSVYEYKIQGFIGTPTSCQIAASTIAQTFAQVTSYDVVNVECSSVFSSLQTISIQYESEIEAKLVSTFQSSGSFQGMYRTRQECEMLLSDEQKRFERRTGLKAVASLCYQERFQQPYAYAARIDGFGKPLMRPFTLSKILYDSPEYTVEQMRALFVSSLAQMPGVFEPRVYVDANDGGAVVVKYYSTRSRAVALSLPLSFEDTQSCQRHRDDAARMFGEFGMIGVASFCARGNSSAEANLYVFGLISAPFDVDSSPTFFSTRQRCEQALPALVESYSRENRGNLTKGQCGYVVDDVSLMGHFTLKLFHAQ